MGTDMSKTDLVDINDVCVDPTLPKAERITEYVRQIKNPYRFKCGKFVVSVSFSDNGLTLEDCIAGIIL